ncbi:hypothetical protein M413DRAFT_447953 [Hebeloma cylindrosporum]|uniref:Uncharacterized protein n=1 Tax=Hebeloma cylindrosporum TaxID=76867 RepID=A0A0C2YB23_HEBCY|nr:hypothetical protein M413DRAFT_447953 [Hebeloma cylindrosporum h7]
MRRAQSVRHYARPSLALPADDLGVLREDESNEDVLRRQLLEKDRECDRLQMSIQALQDQLAQRPPIERIQELEKEYKNLDLILQGTLRENEKSMADMERMKAREKMLERELTRLAGDNWQANLEVPPSSAAPLRSGMNMSHVRSNTLSSITRHSPSPSPHPDSFTPTLSTTTTHHGMPHSSHVSRFTNSPTPYQHQHSDSNQQAPQQQEQQLKEAQRLATLAQIEEMRLLILGMDQRLGAREDKLTKTLERAENEGKKYETAAAAVAAAVKT